MISNFTVTLEGVEFEFKTMNAQRLHLFQVYVLFEGKKQRFHMQRKAEDAFYITDIDKAPMPYKHLEAQLNKAIFDNSTEV